MAVCSLSGADVHGEARFGVLYRPVASVYQGWLRCTAVHPGLQRPVRTEYGDWHVQPGCECGV